MDANEIAIHKVKSHSVSMVLNLLGKSIRQARKASHSHSHGEILAFNIRRADVLGVRITAYSFHVTAALPERDQPVQSVGLK